MTEHTKTILGYKPCQVVICETNHVFKDHLHPCHQGQRPRWFLKQWFVFHITTWHSLWPERGPLFMKTETVLKASDW